MAKTLQAIENLMQDPELLARCQTYAFTVLGMSQLFHAIGMRNVERSVFKMKLFENPLMTISVVLGFFLQFIVTEIPWLVQAFGTVRLMGYEWGILIFLAAMPLVAHELLLIRLPGK